ncbi:CynX/NimT family MFS transporter [Oceanobacillus bengalensis]|uniref:MFS transporter n=1 Tax=Oceanobacillus bengalensis TaxID=1435466 RepID=A0A494Z7R7_9BACI|nr:MFS transporter [Oceanobacillus bengalensis]RKQ18652.1 MFS transporter [Oceanobacillus bengalensis]
MLGTSEQTKRFYSILLIVGIIVVAFNLRPAITSVGPLIGMIRDDIGLSNWSAGLLTSLPLIAFAMMSPVAPRLGNRYTNERAIVIGLAFLLIGVSVRSISLVFLLFSGTLFVGFGIAILNVLLPGIIKDKFPAKVGLMTSIYSTSMGIFAATASGVSIPLASGLDLGWKLALLVWVIPTIAGIIIWFILSRKAQADKQVEERRYVHSNTKQMWRSPIAWQVAIFMGLQSFLFYVTISWLPMILHDKGFSMSTAGWLLSFAQFIGLPASFLVPVIAGRFKSQRWVASAITFCSVVGFSLLLISEAYPLVIISTMFIGFGLSGTFALALAFLGMRARNARDAAELSGMAQALGYVLAAVGPIFIGYLYDITHLWNIPLATIITVAILVFLFGLAAGRDKYVLD